MTESGNTPRIFICYAHKDNESSESGKRWLDRLIEHLAPLELQEQVDIWSDQEIELGENWHDRIQRTLEQVKAAILLVSPAFLASRYIRNSELPVLLKKSKDEGVAILPIILRPCMWRETKFQYPNPQGGIRELSLSDIQVPTTKPLSSLPEYEQDTVLYQVAQRLLKIINSQPPSINPPEPKLDPILPPPPPPRKILILSANPRGTSQLRLDEERREIKEGLKRSKKFDHYEIETIEAVRPRDIRRAILDYEPNIVHFSGHGAGEDGLIFEEETGQINLIDGEALAELFELFSDQVECVVLNACYSVVQAEVIAQHINYVIGMSKAIEDRAAIEFVVGLYDGLGSGKSYEFAYKLGCNGISMMGIPEYLTPQLLVKGNHTSPPQEETPNNVFIESESNIQPFFEQGVDYTQLRNLLAAGEWQEADQETLRIILDIAERREWGWLRSKDIREFPCSVLSDIDKLWITYSSSKFGFSVQKQIWRNIGGQPDQIRGEIFRRFASRVGWQVNEEWLRYEQFAFSSNAPEGHLPSLKSLGTQEVDLQSWQRHLIGFWSRAENCLQTDI
ncbi:MAG: TIR domain-containing protein [Symploca sp. SIO3C6]|nr:TIR domain-containing protein [Symploca sp. SIO3C6]